MKNIKEDISFKPTLKKPVSKQSQNYEKNFKRTMNSTAPDIKLNEVDELLTEKEQSLKKKIFSLAKMEALVFSDPKLTAVYDEMAENGEEKYGYHYNETIMNMIFNDYVLNSPKYLQKYKMAIPKEKKRRDQSGINQLKKAGEKQMAQSGLLKQSEKPQKELSPSGLPKDGVAENAEPATKVQFLVNEKDPENPDVFAYFPEENHDVAGKYKVGYSHIGQHSAVDPRYAAESRPATPEEYANLKAELEGTGYNLEVIEGEMNETTSAGSAGGAAGYVGYAGPAAWGSGDLMKTKGKSNVMRKPIFPGGSIIQESNYLTDPSGFEEFIEMLNEQSDIDYIQKHSEAFGSLDKMSPTDRKIIKKDIQSGTMDTPNLDEKAKSKAQQRFMGMVHAIHKGELSPDEVGGDVAKAAAGMRKKDAEDFAGTKHKGLPEKVDEKSVMTPAETAKGREAQPMKGLPPSEHNPKVYPKLNEYLLPNALIGSDVVDIQPRAGEVPFIIGDGKYQFETATYADGRKDIVVYSFKDDVYYDYAKWKEAMNINEDTQTMIQNNGTSMSNKATPAGDQSSNMDTGARSSGGMNEELESANKLLEEVNNELEAFSIHHNKLVKMSEDRKPSALVLRDRLGSENEKNFKSDMQDSDTKQVIKVEKELQWKDQQTDVGNDPQKLAQDIEKAEIKATDAKGDEALKNVGDSANDKGDEIPKRNLKDEEQHEVDMYRLGQHSLVYDNEPGKRFEDRMKADMGEDIYKMRQEQMKFRAKAPMYNKDPQPVEDTTSDKVQFNKEQSGWNEREGLKESMITGRYRDALNKSRIVDFTLNEVKIIATDKLNEGHFELDFTGLGNSLYSRSVNKSIAINESVVNALETHKFFTNGKEVFAVKNETKKINEGEEKAEKPVVNEQVNKMKHLLDYKPKNFVDTKNVKKNRGF